MKTKNVGLVFFVLIIILFVFVYLKSNQTFNDITSIKSKIAKELDAEQVTIFDVQDKNDYRIVGYTAENILGYAYFEQNEDGAYEYVFERSVGDMRLAAEGIYYDIVGPHEVFISNNDELHTIERKITYSFEFFDSKETVYTIQVKGAPSLGVLDPPQRGSYKGNYRFYNEKGNVIQ